MDGTDLNLVYIVVGATLAILMFPLVWRLTRGPTVLDRILAANVIGSKTTILVVVIGAIFEKLDMFVDIALTYALLNFIVSIGAARFFSHKGLSSGQSIVFVAARKKRAK